MLASSLPFILQQVINQLRRLQRSCTINTETSPLACAVNETFVAAIRLCVPLQFFTLPALYNAITHVNTCPGGVFTTRAQLERLRFCGVVTESIVIDNLTEEIDPTVFWDIEIINGAL